MSDTKKYIDTNVTPVEKMIAKVMKRKELERSAAIDYMLVVATGRLAALWRYDESVPEGKKTKGVLGLVGRKQRAPKSPKIAVPAATEEAPKPKATKPKAPRKPKPARKPKATKPKPAKGEKGEQTEIEAAAE
jgi:hypothetical protein